ncbi:cupin domain-containing protein [Streptomyces bohaiensis]|uniref:Cupin domain-containing protein n=1 Tax=Streptomyces bohaiensis TaxID=1431344 RepID=A0ABX1CG13_9ACTN|nr:cupin domain-containing protein [Streptomyces bohaiensis]NJQ16775.1 cupin domain-containing protein [Streptomyces bohaiensis]
MDRPHRAEHRDAAGEAALPGAVGVSRLRVYDWPAPPGADGRCGGTPHMHLACTEAYAVTGGHGAVEVVTAEGAGTVALAEGDLVWFTPGTVHRLVNEGELRILVLMQNAGLPEAGDAVFTFPPEVLADPDAYRAAAALDPADPEGSARRRRDLALDGYGALRDRAARGDASAATAFHAAALRLVRPRLASWRRTFESGPAAAVARTAAQLAALADGDTAHLRSAAVHRGEAGDAWGMCGRLDTYPARDGTRVI